MVDLDAGRPHESEWTWVPSAGWVIAEGIPHVLAVKCAVNEARESAACIEQQHVDACHTCQVAEAEVLVQLPDLDNDGLAELEAMFPALEDSPINTTYLDEPKSVRKPSPLMRLAIGLLPSRRSLILPKVRKGFR